MSICVDRESKEFKRLVDKLDIHPDNLELVIHEFLNDESRTDNPTKLEILLKFTPKPFKDSAENIEWYLKKEHDKPAVFLDKESALKEQALRDSFYGKGTSILYRNSKGEFIVKTATPQNKELPFIFDNSLVELINSSINKYSSTFGILQTLTQSGTIGNIIIRLKLLDSIKTPNGNRAVAVYDPNDKTIYFDPVAVNLICKGKNDAEKKTQITNILIHELTHQLSVHILRKPNEDLKPEEITFKETITSLYEETLLKIGPNSGFYGMSNVEEFISEALSNKQFQARLLLIKSKKRRSIWSKFINAFAKLLSSFEGAKVDNNILSHILITTLNYIQASQNKNIKDSLYDELFMSSMEPSASTVTKKELENQYDNMVKKSVAGAYRFHAKQLDRGTFRYFNIPSNVSISEAIERGKNILKNNGIDPLDIIFKEENTHYGTNQRYIKVALKSEKIRAEEYNKHLEELDAIYEYEKLQLQEKEDNLLNSISPGEASMLEDIRMESSSIYTEIVEGNLSIQEAYDLLFEVSPYTSNEESINIYAGTGENAHLSNFEGEITQKNTNKEYSLVESTNKELLEVLGNDNNAQSEIKDVVKTVKKGISLDEALKGVESIFTKEEIEQIKQGLNGKRLQVLSVSRLTDPAFFSKEIIKFLEENSKKSLSDPTRTNVIEIWSKHDGVPIQDILKACKKYKVAPMVSFSITGLGDTALEKGVLKYQDLIPLIGQLIESGDLNPLTTTIRIDPILVGETSMDDIKKIVQSCKDLGIKKFVTSLVQSYGYLDGTAKDRKVTSGINNALASEGRSYDWDKYYGKDSRGRINFKPKQLYIDEIGKELLELNKDPEIEIETCSFLIKGLKASACLDPLIIERITGISVTRPDGTYDRDTSRPDCMCYGAHSDMFRVNEKKCFSSCAYCYAGHSNDSNFKYYNEDGTLIDRPLTRVNTLDKDTIENTSTQDENEDQELNISEENQAYMEKTQSINKQLDALNESTLLSATEVNDVAEQIVFWISDYITRLQSEPGYAAQQFGEQFKDKDFSTMNRAEVVRTIGANNIVAICRENFNPKNAKYNSIKTIRKARQICNNFEAVLYKAQPLFLSMEKFSISISKDGKELDVNENINGDNDNFNTSNSESEVKEIEGDLREHWSVETKTLDVLDNMASPVRRELQQCYLTDANGEKVLSEFGVNRRIDVRKATNSIIKWTQGAVTYDEMVKKLSDKIEAHPWVKQLVDKLNDKSGDYTDFQSLFFGDFCKHFQSYHVVIEDNGVFKSIPVNEEPALSNVYKQIESQYKAGEHTLFNFSGVNKSEFKELESTLNDLTKYKEEGLSNTNKQEIARLIGYASTVLGYNTTGELVSENLNADTFKTMHEKLSYIVKAIKDNIDNPDYAPFKFKSGGDIVTTLKDFLRPITQSLEDITTSSTHNNGKMYQSNIVPSYTTKLFQKFSSDSESFKKFVMEEYGDLPWFKNDTGDIDTGWRNEWLKEMVLNPASRALFKHKVQLNFNKRNYMKNMTDMDYTVSVLTEYFSGNSEKGKSEVPAWFRVPMLSNKPSSEFIKFISYRGPGYKDTLTSKFYSIFRQELDRIQTVTTRGLQKGDSDYIENFDKNGKKFMFLDFLNDYLPGATKANTELGKLISDYIDGKDINEIALDEKAKEVIKESMEAKAQAIVNNWEAQGIVKAANKIQNAGKDTNDIKANLINFVWNDTFAAMNIMQLTITDPAFYKHAEDLQKRLAQIHAPGVRGRDHAIDYKGNDVTDGKFRTIKLTDFDGVVSNVIDNLTEVFDRKIDNAAKHEKLALIALKESLVGEKGAFRDINVADAQGYSSPTSYRKKAFRFGKWSKKSEEVYEKLRKGEYNYADLKVAFQPLKPFVYSQVIKETGVKGAVFDKIKVPIQFKNSEYLLIMADAILQGEETSKPNLLRAIYEVMEESHFDQQTGEYKTNGIDTVQFESTTKSGKSGTINLNDLANDVDGEAIAKERIRSAIYKTEERKISEVNPETGAIEERTINIKTDTYSNAVDVIPEEDYCLQQEVPEHFKNHYQVHGTQGRYIIPSELENVYPDGTPVTYNVEGRQVSAQEFKQEYEKTIAENIQESLEELRKELYLDSSNIKDRNIALSRILQKEILASPRYGIDLLIACSVDENGKFRIPLGDPIQSKRVEQLINSIVKNRINKQKIAGGPVVQVSNFGTSKQLSIRFKDKVNGDILMSKEEWEQNKTEHNSYKDYIKENQGGIAYFECFAPIYTNELFTKFADSKGNIDIKAIEKVEPELLKMVGYRIPTEDKYSIVPLKIVGFLPREAGEGIMLPYDITTLSGSDFDVDKLYIMRKEFMVNENKVNMHKILFDEIENSQDKPLKGEAKVAVRELINQFLDNPFNKEILLSQSVAKDYIKLTEKAYNKMLDLYLNNKIIVTPYTSGREYRNNKIVDMTYEVLTHETSADKVLNPGGFDPQKKMGYMVSVYRNSNNYTWEQLEAMSINDLRDLSNTDKNLAFIDTHVQFYKQNAAAGSLIGIFAVHRTAHAVLESTTEDGSSRYFVDITNACKTKQPFNIMGMEFRGNMPFDMRYDRNGQLIGKVLGSLVASSADAVKDPVLNLMNINGNTANILTTLIRMGMPFEDAALFISQSAISDILNTHSKENITKRKSLNRIVNDRISVLKKEHSISNDSEINSEELTREELLKGLKPGVDPKTEYKVLLAFSNLSKISQALRMPTFATRFNTVSNAAGPLIIDNLTIEYTMDNLTNASSIVNGAESIVTMTDIFDEHPILKEFAEGIHIAKEILGNMPTNSRGFRNVLETLKENNTLNSILRDRKLFGYLSDFYQSYLLMSNNVVNEKDLKYYISEFPKEFKNSKFKEKYQDNLLIQAIKYGTDKNNRLTLNIDTTGLDTQAKERLSSAWIDLHKVDPELSIKLFKYNFFKGGIGYNPKTFMNLLPIYVKEQIPGYIDTFRLLPATSPWLVVNQFMRNNWNNDALVPTIKTVSFTSLDNGNLLINKKSEIDSIYGASFFKVNFKDKTGDNYKLFEVIYRDPEGKYIECKETTPLGNNKDYLEISSDVINPMEISSEVLKDIEEELKGDELNNLSTENFIDDTTENNESSEIESLLYDVLVIEGVRTKEQADDLKADYRELPPAEKSRREDKMKKFFENRLNKLGIEVNEDLTDKLYNELCK